MGPVYLFALAVTAFGVLSLTWRMARVEGDVQALKQGLANALRRMGGWR